MGKCMTTPREPHSQIKINNTNRKRKIPPSENINDDEYALPSPSKRAKTSHSDQNHDNNHNHNNKSNPTNISYHHAQKRQRRSNYYHDQQQIIKSETQDIDDGYIWKKLQNVPTSTGGGYLNPLIINKTQFMVINKHPQNSESYSMFNINAGKWSKKTINQIQNDSSQQLRFCSMYSKTNEKIYSYHQYKSKTIEESGKNNYETKRNQIENKINEQTLSSQLRSYNMVTYSWNDMHKASQIRIQSPAKSLIIDGTLHIFYGNPAVHIKWDPKYPKTYSTMHVFNQIGCINDYEIVYIKEKRLIFIIGQNSLSKRGEIYYYCPFKQICQKLNIKIPSAACMQIQCILSCENGRFVVIFRGRGLFIFDTTQETFKCVETWDFPSTSTYEIYGVVMDKSNKLILIIKKFMKESNLNINSLSNDILKMVCKFHGFSYIHLLKEDGQHWMVHFADLLRDHSDQSNF